MGERLATLLSGSRDSVAYMVDQITHICRDMKKREPGSEGEREAAEYMAGILRDECGCTDVKVESFKEHPSAFYGYFYVSAVLNVLCCACFFFNPALCVVVGVLALLLFILQFVMYRPVIDPLFTEREGTNVTGVRPCTGEVRQRIFLNGHIDAAWEFPLNYLFGGIVFEIPGLMALLGVLFYIALSISSLLGAPGPILMAGLCGLAFVPFFVLVARTYDHSRVVDGANDNLTGCYMGISLLRDMERAGIDLEHTEIGVILTGSEEAGLKGAKAWCDAHRDDYRDVPTYIVCYDTIHDPRFLMVNRRDLNATVKCDGELCDAFLSAAEEAGVPCRSGHVPLFGGSTDSAAFVQGGFRSMGVTGLSHKLEDYYHTRNDTYTNLNEEGLDNCYRATVVFLDRLCGSE